MMIYNSDCIKIINGLEDNSLDLLLTDPPYGYNYVSNMRGYENDITKKILNDDETSAFKLFDDMIDTIYPKMKTDSHIYIFMSWKTQCHFIHTVEKYFKMKNIIIWDKGGFSMGDLEGNYADEYESILFATKGNKKLCSSKRPTNVLKIQKVNPSDLIHPMEKPVKLMRELINNSTNEGDVVCDPFMGSGATGVACGNTREFIGIEMDKRHFDMAKSRIKQVTDTRSLFDF